MVFLLNFDNIILTWFMNISTTLTDPIDDKILGFKIFKFHMEPSTY